MPFAGVVVGAFVGHFLGKAVSRLARKLDRESSVVTASGLFFTGFGLLLGLAIAALGGLAIKDLPVVGVYLLPLLYNGCIVDVVAKGFIEGDLVTPAFVLEELQSIAGSDHRLQSRPRMPDSGGRGPERERASFQPAPGRPGW